MRTKFGVNSSSHFSFPVRTHKHTKSQILAYRSPYPTHRLPPV